MNYYTKDFDHKLDAIDIYQSYPLLKPFVGSDYGKGCPKILLIAESHYLPPESTAHLDSESWYAGSEGDLSPKEQTWTRTRGILNKPLGGWRARGHAIYRQLEAALIKAGLPANDSVFRQVAFMNAFQRPAKTGDTIKNTKMDGEIAANTVNKVIEVLQPDHIIFVSTKAKRRVGKKLKFQSEGVDHPACPWWNIKRDGITSKERFIDLISGYWNTKGNA